MKKLTCIFVVLAFSSCCNASDTSASDYSISTLYHGVIGKKQVTMALTTTANSASGKYVYDRYGNVIYINGSHIGNNIKLLEKLKSGTAKIYLSKNNDTYEGTWCSNKCVPIALQSNTSFQNGAPKNINLVPENNTDYTVTLNYSTSVDVIKIVDAIDTPSLEFIDLNGDGYYDLIITTDLRPTNGSQNVYFSTKNGFIKNEELSRANGSIVFNPFKKYITYDTKDDCCNQYGKEIYKLENGEFTKTNTLSYDYSKNEGVMSNGNKISKQYFESY